MKGAIADPAVAKSSIPKKSRIIMTGISQNFFLVLINSISSLIKSIAFL
jgi:hypothetical protein